MPKEQHKRSILRSIIWRAIGIVLLALVTFVFTESFIVVGLITVLHHFTFLWIYYLHERFWQLKQLANWTGARRKVVRVLTYEIILGYCVLGLISLLFTGSWTAATLIAAVYIGNKLWMYVFYDYIWDKIRWGKVV